jgi:ubiquinone/menaquinone biosynthesis C-methylase UbiE
MSSGIVERIDPDLDSLYFNEHLARYRFAASHLTGGPTLDIATGTGYGADFLTGAGCSPVVGADVDLVSLHAARTAYPSSEIAFVYADGTNMPFTDASFRSVVTLETLEHIEDDSCFLREIVRVLVPDGVCVLSTPDRDYSVRHSIHNPYHVREYVESELRALLANFFEQVTIYYQGFSSNYHSRLDVHSHHIVSQKRQLHPALRFGIDRIYRPVKRIVPTRVTNTAIKALLNTSYPQPTRDDIIIGPERPRDASVLVAVCHQPMQL